MRSAALALIPMIAVGGCARGAEPRAAATRTDGPAACTAIGTELASFTESLEATSGDAKTRRVTYPGMLELMLSFESAAGQLETGLAKVVADRNLEAQLSSARGSLTRAGQFARKERDAMEQHARAIAPLAKETQQAWTALRSTCDAKRAPDCIAVREVIGRFDAAETSADHHRAVASLTALRVSPPVAKARDRAVVASKAVQAAVEARSEQTSHMPKRWVGVQKDLGTAMATLADACKGDVPIGTDLVASMKPDPRKLTVLVHMKPPASVEKSLLSLAKAAADEDERAFYEARAEGAFGSGFFLVQRSEKGSEVLVVTNRHVVELGDRATLELADGTALGAADVVYASPTHDLAILRPAANISVKEGFALAAAPAKDQQTVIATGFPGLVGRPSYQTTKGYVSNESFRLEDGGSRPLTYVQHTAPNDPGSSGGPLTDEAGRVLGVNTLKVTGREGVGLAVPSRYVAETIRSASLASAHPVSMPDRLKRARLACLGFIGELGTADPRMPVLEQMISNHLVGAVGLDAAAAISDEEGFDQLWNVDSVRAMRIATLLRVRSSFMSGGGPSVLETCDDLDQASARPEQIKIRVRLGNFETREMALRWEQGTFKVDGIDGPKGAAVRPGAPRKLPPPGPPATGAARGKKVTPPRAR